MARVGERLPRLQNPISDFTFLSTAKSGKSRIKNPFLDSPKGTHPKLHSTLPEIKSSLRQKSHYVSSLKEHKETNKPTTNYFKQAFQMNNHPVIFNVVYIIPHDNRSGGLGHGYTRIDRWEDHHVACRPHSGIGFVRDLNSDKAFQF